VLCFSQEEKNRKSPRISQKKASEKLEKKDRKVEAIDVDLGTKNRGVGMLAPSKQCLPRNPSKTSPIRQS
jgi:hypothetical protein